MTALPIYADTANARATVSALQSYARLLGAYRAALAPRQKHWWHVSLLPSVAGFGTGKLRHGTDEFELIMNPRDSLVTVMIGNKSSPVSLSGQSATELHRQIAARLHEHGIAAAIDSGRVDIAEPALYDASAASLVAKIFFCVADSLNRFRARLEYEASPVQLWPHHFDLALLVLTGRQITGKDPADEVQADEQINFGFLFGDAAINEPYFYVTFYTEPGVLPSVEWQAPAERYTGDFSAALIRYQRLAGKNRPPRKLTKFWGKALNAGIAHVNRKDKERA